MRAAATVLGAALLFGLLTVSGSILGAFTSTTANPTNSITAATDFRAPTIARTAIGKTAGGVTGFIRQGGSYYVYAEVSDTGNPASGVSTVRSNTNNVTTGATATSLAFGAFTGGTLTYNYRTGSLTANATLSAGAKSYVITATDVAGNTSTLNGSVTVDNTAPTATTVQATNNSGVTVGRPELNDRIVYTSSEQLDANSILSGWSGASTNVVIRINNNAAGGMDQLQVYNATNTTQLPLGSVSLGGNGYVAANTTFGATGTASRMSQSAATITIILGTPSATATTAAANTTMSWTPSATATDRAGNPMSVTAANETGAADREF